MKIWKAAMIAAAAALAVGPARAEPAPTLPRVAALKLFGATFIVADLGRAKLFYTKGLGLTLGPLNETPAYTEAPLRFPGGDAMLLLIAPKGAAPTRTGVGRVVLAVPDLKALEAQLVSAGYHLSGPITEAPQFHLLVGHVTDPEGNDLELIQSSAS